MWQYRQKRLAANAVFDTLISWGSRLLILSISSLLHISLQISSLLFAFLLHPFFACHPASPLAVRLTVAMVMILFLISVMWCLIRLHWGVCHYFISRAIWWASVCCWKTSCLRSEQWMHRQRSVKAPVFVVCEGADGEEDKTEWDRARDMWGSACCRYIIFPSWLTVLSCRKDVWIVIWKECLSPGSSVFLCSVRLARQGGVSAATQQEALCVCFQPSTEKALYLQYSVPTIAPSIVRGFLRWVMWCGPLMLVIQWNDYCSCCDCCR